MKTVLVYDINTLPEGVTIKDVVKSYEDQGIILFDSKKGSNPYVININIHYFFIRKQFKSILPNRSWQCIGKEVFFIFPVIGIVDACI